MEYGICAKIARDEIKWNEDASPTNAQMHKENFLIWYGIRSQPLQEGVEAKLEKNKNASRQRCKNANKKEERRNVQSTRLLVQ